MGVGVDVRVDLIVLVIVAHYEQLVHVGLVVGAGHLCQEVVEVEFAADLDVAAD